MKFEQLNLHASVYAGVSASGYSECTPIQAEAIPHILAGRDLAGLAQTGTGKTAAFVLPLIERIVRSRETTEGSVPNTTVPFADWRQRNMILILVPTRELCEQVFQIVEKLGATSGMRAVSVYGGTGYESQKAGLAQGVEFVVATPGRLIDLFKERLLDLNQVRAIVFDEADRMFDMGFKDDMRFILSRVPRERQFLVFSATLNFDVLNTAYEFGASPVEINVSRDQTKAENVKDEILHVGQHDKPKFLLSLLISRKPKQTIIFTNFKDNVERIAKFLSDNGQPALGISSLLSQSQRTRIIEQFKATNDKNILVATDLAARGLDIKGVDLVVNFDLPDDAENYVHRIGRTGRAGTEGTAISLVSDRDVESSTRIESYLGHKLTVGWIEDSEIVKEMRDFPNAYDSRRKGSWNDRPQGGDRGRNDRPRGDRDGARRDGPPRDGNRDSQRGPNDRDARPRHDNRDARPQQPRGNGPDRPRHADRPTQAAATGTASAPRPHSGPKPPHHTHQTQRTGAPRSFKHVPKTSVWSKVSGFIKNIFGKPSSASTEKTTGGRPQDRHRTAGDRHDRGPRPHGGPGRGSGGGFRGHGGPRRHHGPPRPRPGTNGPRPVSAAPASSSAPASTASSASSGDNGGDKT